MKVITLTQPWATLVAIGVKKIETRGWNTSHRGPLAIHAAKGFPAEARSLCNISMFFKKALERAGYKSPDDLPLGQIIATCDLAHTAQMNELHVFPACQGYAWQKRTWLLDAHERAFGVYAVGRWMWFLENVVKLDQPITTRGYQRLWNFEFPSKET